MRMVTLLVVLTALEVFPVYGFGWTGRVVRVESDGSLVAATNGDKLERIHLYGVTLPESGHPMKVLAVQMINALATGAHIETKDVSNRTAVVKIVRSRGLCLNTELVRCGYASVSSQQCRLLECADWRRLEMEAQEKRLGMWAGWIE